MWAWAWWAAMAVASVDGGGGGTVAAAPHVVVLGGGDSPAAGDAALAAVRARLPAWAGLLEWSAGAPWLVASAQVPGLKPGFHVVLGGVCDAAQKDAALALVKAFEPGAYLRPLTQPVPPSVAAQKCPVANAAWVFAGVLRHRSGGRELTVTRWESRQESTPAYRDWQVVATLRGRDGAVLEEKVLTRDAVTQVYGLGCEPQWSEARAGVTLKLTGCSVPRGCPTPAEVDARVVWGAGENQVTEDGRVVRRHTPPCAGE